MLQRVVEESVLAGRRMSERMIRYRSREENAEVQIKESIRDSALARTVDAEEWSNKIAELEEGVVSAKRYAASMLEIAEKAQDHAEELGSLKEAKEIIEICPQFRVTRGSAVCHAEIKSEEYMAMAEIAPGKVYLAQARVHKAKISPEWAKGMRESSE